MMTVEWIFIDAQRIRGRNRLTPPQNVRELVVSEHEFYGECVWWNYDSKTELAVISNTDRREFVNFGTSEVHRDNSIVPDSGLLDAAFESIEAGDCLVFLGEKTLLEGDDRHLYLLHEDQIYNLIRDPLDHSP
jgi:hypothetical protein